jgi:hypothetical protein
LTLFHMWGNVVYFYNHVQLQHTVCLQLDYLARDTLAHLLNPQNNRGRRNMLIKQGTLSHRDLSHIWKMVHPDYHEHIINMMELFHVCFRISSATLPFVEQQSIIPSLLPKTAPDGLTEVWPDEQPVDIPYALFIELRYNSYPEEILSHFIAGQMCAITKCDGNLSSVTLWKQGIIINIMDQQLFVRSIKEVGICVQARGTDQQKCSTVLQQALSNLRELELQYTGLSAEYAFKCPHLQHSSSCRVVVPRANVSAANPCCSEKKRPVLPKDLLRSFGIQSHPTIAPDALTVKNVLEMVHGSGW